jgi:hypothetical protein
VTAGSALMAGDGRPAARVIKATVSVTPKYLAECDISNSNV